MCQPRTFSLLVLLALAGCSVTTAGDFEASQAPSNSRSDSPSFPGGGGASSAGPKPGLPSAPPLPGPSSGGSGEVQAGILTAGVWDDNLNFGRFLTFRAQEHQRKLDGLLPIDESVHRAVNATPSVGVKRTLDVSLVIDTTGSMGDEIRYLQREFDALSATIARTYPDAQQRWSLVAYKDRGDEYVVRPFDFRGDTVDFRSQLAKLNASGGGDFPEAPDQALQAADGLSWRADADTARILFWVADAPHHDHRAQAMVDAILGARDKGIHVYPVASSGVDQLTELTMRSAAQLTGGRYIFLTDDSGVGGAHKEPSIPCYFVTKLDRAILRMVDIEMTGQYREPIAADVLRTGGDPVDGSCQLASGPAQAF